MPGIWQALVGLKCDKGLLRKNKRKRREWGKKVYLGGKLVNETQDQDPYVEMGLIHWPGGTWKTCAFLCLDVIKAYSTGASCLEPRGKPHMS